MRLVRAYDRWQQRREIKRSEKHLLRLVAESQLPMTPREYDALPRWKQKELEREGLDPRRVPFTR